MNTTALFDFLTNNISMIDFTAEDLQHRVELSVHKFSIIGHITLEGVTAKCMDFSSPFIVQL